MNRRKVRECIELFTTLCFSWLYIPHLLCYSLMDRRELNADLDRLAEKTSIRMSRVVLLLNKLHHDAYFRTIFYHRIGLTMKLLIGWYRKGSPTFIIPSSLKIGGGLYAPHCYATVLNAASIGENFTVLQCTTLGRKNGKRPVIGNNVSIGANVNVLGGVIIGDYTTVGAGSVVTKDTPPYSVVAGVPAKVIKMKENH